ncbi:hypothetical protein NP233_g4976 [Leucocoprinus birnbaumii]|uniref:BD-FAE-like domain-containing protein n=1 Tax=Leucocoprinus birnbaumii TaxID=56174 RepID=A0AAD5YV10_9AGAR|nr:hypothetical protein NP233_g4976 [Leucocoprinus birnbaumii]
MSLLVLSAANVREVVSSFDTDFLQDLMGRVFVAISQPEEKEGKSSIEEGPDIQTPHRTTINMPYHTTLLMPARISCSQPPLEGTSVKVVSVPRKHDDVRGLPATTFVLNDDTGAVEAVVNARELTALRNAAGSLLSSTLVGIRNPEHIVMFGAGKQVESHINVFLRHYRGISSCTIINRTLNERALDLFRSATAAFPRVTFHLHSQLDKDSIENAVKAAEIIICATSSTSPLFPSSWVRSGAHVILIGSYKPTMQEVEETLVKRAISATEPDMGQRITQMLLVDSRAACMQEAGDLIKAEVDSASVHEIGELILLKSVGHSQLKPEVSQASSGEEDPTISFTGPVTMFKSVGVGLQDVVMAKEVVSHAKALGTGSLIERPPIMDAVARLNDQGIVNIPEVLEPTGLAFKEIIGKRNDLQDIKKETFQYGATDRHKLDVYYPRKPQTGKTPIVFWIYGGGFVTGERVLPAPFDVTYGNVGAFLGDQGFITVIPDYRLASEPYSAQYPKAAEDIRDAVAWIVAHTQELTSTTTPSPDTNSLFLMGHSAGASHLGTLILEPEVLPVDSPLRSHIKGVILLAGMYYNDPSTGFESLMALYYGDKLDSHSVLALVRSAKSKGLTALPKFCLGEAEFEAPRFSELRKPFQAELNALVQTPIPFYVAKGHNHISMPHGLWSGQGEDWALEITKWIRENL